MNKQSLASQSPSKKYLVVTIFLVVLMVAGGIYAFSTKEPESKSQAFQTQPPSATIEPAVEPTIAPTASASAVKTMN
jgi:hypothetical protein